MRSVIKDDNTKKPFFSVVIPTYNCADLLKRSLASVLAQSFGDYEIIVIDNSSVDETGEVLDRFAHDKLRCITVNNEGVIAYSRNRGIKDASGQWIAFLDSDDLWMPDKLEKVRNAISGDPEVILVCHDEWHVDHGQRVRRLRYGPSGNDLYERLLFKGNCMSTSATCLRKDIAIGTGGFSERKDFVTVEDYEYWIRLAQEGNFLFMEDILGEWHTHSDNYSSNARMHAEALITVREHHFALWLQKFPGSGNHVIRGRGRTMVEASRDFLKGRQFSTAGQYASKAIRLDPFNWKAWASLAQSLLHIPA